MIKKVPINFELFSKNTFESLYELYTNALLLSTKFCVQSNICKKFIQSSL